MTEGGSFRRNSLAEELVGILNDVDIVTDAGIRGSVSRPDADRYTDIDLFVSSEIVNDRDLIDRISRTVGSYYDLLFFDWAKSLLPQTRVISYYIDNLPIYWNIDIEYIIPEELKTITKDEIAYQMNEHYLKLWCLTLKHIHRKNKLYLEEVPRLFRRVMGPNEQIGDNNLVLAMKTMLDFLMSQLPSRFFRFLAECKKELELIT